VRASALANVAPPCGRAWPGGWHPLEASHVRLTSLASFALSFDAAASDGARPASDRRRSSRERSRKRRGSHAKYGAVKHGATRNTTSSASVPSAGTRTSRPSSAPLAVTGARTTAQSQEDRERPANSHSSGHPACPSDISPCARTDPLVATGFLCSGPAARSVERKLRLMMRPLGRLARYHLRSLTAHMRRVHVEL
jgi:hypothetical protein